MNKNDKNYIVSCFVNQSCFLSATVPKEKPTDFCIKSLSNPGSSKISIII